MSIVFKGVSFEWPNGKELFSNLNLSLGSERYGLVGPNGVGKTTLANLILGSLEPSRGSILRSDQEPAIFLQKENPPRLTLAEYLLDSQVFENPTLLSFLKAIPFERRCDELSGGEWTRARLAKVAGQMNRFLILDEPTNHLDREGRAAVHEFIELHSGGFLMISHDRELLEKVDRIFELTSKGLSVYTGGWSFYYSQRENERARLMDALQQKKRQRKIAQESRQKKLENQAKRQKRGQAQADKGGIPKILAGARKRAAQKTQGAIDQKTMQAIDESVSEAWRAYEALKVDPVMYFRLPQVQVPKGKLIVEARDFNFRYRTEKEDLWPQNLNFVIEGPARLAIRGSNGTGKSTLIRLLRGDSLDGQSRGLLELGSQRTSFLDQNLSQLKLSLTVKENFQQAVNLSEEEARNLLAMFLFFGEQVNQKTSELSGGEALRLALSMALASPTPAEALILDEPTNNLDFLNLGFIEQVLKQYRGALIVISHDQTFLSHLELTAEIDF